MEAISSLSVNVAPQQPVSDTYKMLTTTFANKDVEQEAIKLSDIRLHRPGILSGGKIPSKRTRTEGIAGFLAKKQKQQTIEDSALQDSAQIVLTPSASQ